VVTGLWWGSLKERDHLEDPRIDDRIILKCIFKKWDRGHALDWSGSGHGQVAGTCVCGNELPHSIKCGIFLD
jgi:hypothetical protein